jgi:ketosteroid isomerase-like protein
LSQFVAILPAMSEDNVELFTRSAARFFAGDPDLEVYSDDFQLVNLPDAPWQPSPGPKGLQEWIDFTNEIADDWGAEFDAAEAVDSEHVVQVGKIWAKFRATGIHGEFPIASIATIVDGKITRIEAHHTREQALKAAGLTE